MMSRCDDEPISRLNLYGVQALPRFNKHVASSGHSLLNFANCLLQIG